MGRHYSPLTVALHPTEYFFDVRLKFILLTILVFSLVSQYII